MYAVFSPTAYALGGGLLALVCFCTPLAVFLAYKIGREDRG